MRCGWSQRVLSCVRELLSVSTCHQMRDVMRVTMSSDACTAVAGPNVFGRVCVLFSLSSCRCHQRHVVEEDERTRRRSRADAHWALLEELAKAKAGE